VDVLVANAALPASGSVLDFEVDELDAALDVNLRAPMVLSRLLAPGMVARGRGSLIFISSVAGKIATRSTAVYSATKFGLRGFAIALREDLAARNVGVTIVNPGFIREAGMFAETGVSLPVGVGTRSPGDVARAVVEAIVDNPAELTVAAADQRLGALLASVAPGAIHFLERNFGGQKLAAQLEAAPRKRR
jgi:short-subunit dehydrogenase